MLDLNQAKASADHLASKSKMPGASGKFHVIAGHRRAGGPEVFLVVAGAALPKVLPDAQPGDPRILYTAEKGASK